MPSVTCIPEVSRHVDVRALITLSTHLEDHCTLHSSCKVTPFHVQRQIRGPDGAPIGQQSWDTIKHLPGLADTRAGFKQVLGKQGRRGGVGLQ